MMRTEPAAIVQSVHEAEVREVNALEQRIAKSEDDADAKLWEQAAKVVALLDSGMSQRELAASWINARTKKPYSQMHVSYTSQAFEKRAFQPQPRFRDAYQEVAHAKPASGNGGGELAFDFTAALFRIHDVLSEMWDRSSESDRKMLVSDLRAFLNTIETRVTK